MATEEGRQAARAYARWYLGDPNWADIILDAADAPTLTWHKLADEGDEVAKRRVAAKETNATP